MNHFTHLRSDPRKYQTKMFEPTGETARFTALVDLLHIVRFFHIQIHNQRTLVRVKNNCVINNRSSVDNALSMWLGMLGSCIKGLSLYVLWWIYKYITGGRQLPTATIINSQNGGRWSRYKIAFAVHAKIKHSFLVFRICIHVGYW